MNWITKLERKFGRYCIPNLISILIGGQILVYAVELFVNQYIRSTSIWIVALCWRARSGGSSRLCLCRSRAAGR